jgi:hypothetical protein
MRLENMAYEMRGTQFAHQIPLIDSDIARLKAGQRIAVISDAMFDRVIAKLREEKANAHPDAG